jgi:hypothetical protein
MIRKKRKRKKRPATTPHSSHSSWFFVSKIAYLALLFFAKLLLSFSSFGFYFLDRNEQDFYYYLWRIANSLLCL